MKTLPLSDVKTHLSQLIEKVQEQGDSITITKNGKPAAIIVNPEEYESWTETMAILSDADLMRSIKNNLKSLKLKKGKLYSLDELFE